MRNNPAEIGSLVEAGEVSAYDAATTMLEMHCLLIGTTRSQVLHDPAPHTVTYDNAEWPLVHTIDAEPMDVLRMSGVVSTAIAAGVLGDVNARFDSNPNQRRLTDGPQVFGWHPDTGTAFGYRVLVRQNLLDVILERQDDILGYMDIVKARPSTELLAGLSDYSKPHEQRFRVMQAFNEPGHYITTCSRQTLGSIPIRGADFLALGNDIQPL